MPPSQCYRRTKGRTRVNSKLGWGEHDDLSTAATGICEACKNRFTPLLESATNILSRPQTRIPGKTSESGVLFEYPLFFGVCISSHPFSTNVCFLSRLTSWFERPAWIIRWVRKVGKVICLKQHAMAKPSIWLRTEHRRRLFVRACLFWRLSLVVRICLYCLIVVYFGLSLWL